MDDALSVDVRNAKSLFFNLYLVEAYSKKKIKFPALAEGGEPENHEAPAKGSTLSFGKLCPLGWEEEVSQVLRGVSDSKVPSEG